MQNSILSPWYGMANAPADPLGLAHPDMPALARLSGEIGRPSTLMACQDYFVCLAALALFALLLLQTKTEKSSDVAMKSLAVDTTVNMTIVRFPL